MYVLKCDCGLNVLYLVGMTDDLQKEKIFLDQGKLVYFYFRRKKRVYLF